MAYFVERRKYQRGTGAICKALMSIDGKRWTSVELSDISAGGLKFTSTTGFEPGTSLHFNLTVFNMLSEFNMKVIGHIVRVEQEGNRFGYGVKYDVINKYDQVQLDEIIKSKSAMNETKQPVTEDGIYTFLFMPRIRPTNFRNKIRTLR